MTSIRNLLIYISILYNGDWEKIRDSICRKERFHDDAINVAVRRLKCKTVTILDDNYPKFYKDMFKPPFVLYYYGDLSILNNINNNLSVVGSRNCSEYGIFMTEKIISELPKNMVIVSGLAKGIDAVAHTAAINNGLKTVAILGSGIDYCYPKENEELYKYMKENELVISEYPNDVIPSQSSFPFRNRIVSTSSMGVLVTEAHEYSGTLITVGFALQSGREVMCVPHRAIDNTQCNRLISEGATLVENGNDVIETLKIKV